MADALDGAELEEIEALLREETGPALLSTLLKSHRTAERLYQDGKVLSQERLARRIGCSTKAYGDWEAGLVIPSPRWLPAIAEALELDDRHTWLLYMLVTGSVPPPVQTRTESSGFSKQMRMARETIMRSPHVAYLMDDEFNVRAHNEKFDELYGWTYADSEDDANVNMVRFVFFHPLAPKVLWNWEEDWLSIAMVFYDLAARHNPRNSTLLKIRLDMNRYPRVLRAQTVEVPQIMADSTGGQPLFELRRHKVLRQNHPDKPISLDSQLKSINQLPGWLEVHDCSLEDEGWGASVHLSADHTS